MLIGFASSSLDLKLQRIALKAAGCQKVFNESHCDIDYISDDFRSITYNLKKNDILVLTQLECLVHSAKELIKLMQILRISDVGLWSLAEPWVNTTSPHGDMLLQLLSGIVEFEQSVINRCTCNWREAAKQRGVRFGRPSKLTADQIAFAKRSLQEGESVHVLAKLLNVHRSTLHRVLSNA